MGHKYTVGQLVHAAGTHFADRTSGIYEIIRLMPESNGEFSYRIKIRRAGRSGPQASRRSAPLTPNMACRHPLPRSADSF